MNFKETEIGFELRTNNLLVFFGNKDSGLHRIKSHYSDFRFKSVHQVHGQEIVESTSICIEGQTADAHWTAEKGLGLIVKTADCIPLVAFRNDFSKIVSIHAGWRGVQNKIVHRFFSTQGPDWTVFVGPHILKESFQIQADCLTKLQASTNLPISDWYDNGRADLLKIVNDQLRSCGIFETRINCLTVDTFKDNRFHSFRRDGEKAGRQISFIALNQLHPNSDS